MRIRQASRSDVSSIASYMIILWIDIDEASDLEAYRTLTDNATNLTSTILLQALYHTQSDSMSCQENQEGAGSNYNTETGSSYWHTKSTSQKVECS